MNRAPKGEYWDFSCNVLCGCPGCSILKDCFARKFYARKMTKCKLCQEFTPHFHADRLEQITKRKKPARIFLNLTGDTFGGTCASIPYIAPELSCWISWEESWEVLKITMRMSPQHTFLVLTKKPENIPPGWNDDLRNLWVGVSETGSDRDEWRRRTLQERLSERMFLSLEPLLHWPTWNDLDNIKWVIEGALTGSNAKKSTPAPHWQLALRMHCGKKKNGTALWEKSNLRPYWGEDLIQQRPEAMEGG